MLYALAVDLTALKRRQGGKHGLHVVGLPAARLAVLVSLHCSCLPLAIMVNLQIPKLSLRPTPTPVGRCIAHVAHLEFSV